MEYKVTKLEDAKADVHLTFSAEDIEEAYVKAYKKAASKAKINGFRPGKAPLEMVRKALGESVSEDAITILLNDTFQELYPKFDFKPYNQPKIEIEKFERKETLVAKATFEIGPEVKLGNYKNFPVNVFEVQVEDSDISENLKEIQYNLAKQVAKEPEEVVEENDFIEFELATFADDGSVLNENQPSKYYMGRIPTNKDLEANFLGLKVNEEKEFDYTFPEDFPTQSTAGKTIKYKIKINGIFKVNLPELNDELAKEWNDSESLEKVKQDFKENIKKQSESSLKEKYYNELLEQVIQNSAYTLPESLIEDEVKNLFHQTIHQYGLEHMTMEKFAEMAKTEVSELKKSFEQRALRNVKGYLTLYEIARAENIEIKQEEMKSRLDEYAGRVGQEKFKKMDANSVVRNIHDNILFDKIFELLLENADKKVESGVSLSRANSILSEANKE